MSEPIICEYTSAAEIERIAAEHGLPYVDIEQTERWQQFQDTVDGRNAWGAYVIKRADTVLAVAAFVAFHTHGYTYLRATHGPVWINHPSEQDEREVADALVRAIAQRDNNIAFVRFDTWHNVFRPVLSTIPYDHTVVVDLTGGEDAILARMKKWGRKNVRRSLRECPGICSDETEQAFQSFDEYYKVIEETADRDGFAPATKDTIESMIRVLGREHIRLYVNRVDGKVAAWYLITKVNTHAAAYYGGSLTEEHKLRVSDRLMYFVFLSLADEGITEIDLMGIGSQNYPVLNTLNQFKTKFTKEVTEVAASHDFPIKKGLYTMLVLVQRVRRLLGLRK